MSPYVFYRQSHVRKFNQPPKPARKKKTTRKNPLPSRGSEPRGPPGFAVVHRGAPGTESGGGVLPDTPVPGRDRSPRGLGRAAVPPHDIVTLEKYNFKKSKNENT